MKLNLMMEGDHRTKISQGSRIRFATSLANREGLQITDNDNDNDRCGEILKPASHAHDLAAGDDRPHFFTIASGQQTLSLVIFLDHLIETALTPRTKTATTTIALKPTTTTASC